MANGGGAKPATSARIYDYFLGGTHNFPADRDAAKGVAQRFPRTPALARNTRAFLRRAVRQLAGSGVKQFLDIGSGIPTEGNVHEVVAETVPDARVVYVDIDPVAVSESLEILEDDERTIAVWGDLRDPQAILAHPQVRGLIEFDRPVGLLLNAVLHFVPDDDQAYGAVTHLLAALAPGSHLLVSHISIDGQNVDADDLQFVRNTYEQQTTTPFRTRTRGQIERFMTGLDLLDPGLVWLTEWRPGPGDPMDFADDPSSSGVLAAVGRLR
jgi:trans-aconitate methyltransferase